MLRYKKSYILLSIFFHTTSRFSYFTLSLHDALPISLALAEKAKQVYGVEIVPQAIENAKTNAKENEIENVEFEVAEDRKSTRLNSSHVAISYAVFCLKKKKNKRTRNKKQRNKAEK